MNEPHAQLKRTPANVFSVKRKIHRLLRTLYIYRWYYLMMVPGIVYYLIYHYYPMAGLIIAFKDFNILKGIWGSPWIGLDNFREVFSSPDFPKIFKNTLIISFYRILFNMVPDLILALILNELRVRWFKKMVQTITYGPFFLSWTIVYGLVFAFFAPEAGLVSTWMRDSGAQPLDLLTNKDLFRPMIILTDIWKNTGFGAIIYLATLATINQELYEGLTVIDTKLTDRDKQILKQLVAMKYYPALGSNLFPPKGVDLASWRTKMYELHGKMLFTDKSSKNWPAYREELMTKYNGQKIVDNYTKNLKDAGVIK